MLNCYTLFTLLLLLRYADVRLSSTITGAVHGATSELCIPIATFTGQSRLHSAMKECLAINYCRTKNYRQRSFS